jgi:Pyruvate/2-oxoacid:ferredoxin oxidoreductase delta subunit
MQDGFKTVQDAFTHESNMQHNKQGVHKDNYVVLDGRVMMRVMKGGRPAKPQADKWNVYKCRECPTVCSDRLLMQVHKFLHEDLTFFFCPDCDNIFGLPSKLKRHYFLSHGKFSPLN